MKVDHIAASSSLLKPCALIECGDASGGILFSSLKPPYCSRAAKLPKKVWLGESEVPSRRIAAWLDTGVSKMGPESGLAKRVEKSGFCALGG